MMHRVGATAQLQKTLDMLRFKCWYSETPKAAGEGPAGL